MTPAVSALRHAANLAARRYAEHPTARNRIAAETRAIMAGAPMPEPPAKKPAQTGD